MTRALRVAAVAGLVLMGSIGYGAYLVFRPAEKYIVTYKVTSKYLPGVSVVGPGFGTINYTNDSGGTNEVVDQTLPWTLTTTARAGDVLRLGAMTEHPILTQSITVQIFEKDGARAWYGSRESNGKTSASVVLRIGSGSLLERMREKMR